VKLDPFNLHPEVKIQPSKEKKHLTFEEISSIIRNKIEGIDPYKTPRWGYGSFDMKDMLLEVLEEMERECH